MPEERQIEKLLRAHGEKRQRQAPGEMHPATRRLLHGEIVRQYGRPPPKRGLASWWQGWRLFGWAGGAGVVLVLACWAAFRPSRPAELAKTEEVHSSQDAFVEQVGEARGRSAAAAVTTAPQAQIQPTMRPELDPSSPQEAFLLAPQPVQEEAREIERALTGARAPATETLLSRNLSLAQALPTAAPPSPAMAAADTASAHGALPSVAESELIARLSDGVLFTNEVIELAERSYDVARRAQPQALAAFIYLQHSNLVQLVGTDGSVYSGRFSGAPQNRARFIQDPNTLPQRAFQVVGSNSTVRQQLVIQGVVQFEPTPAAPANPKLLPVPQRVEGTATLEDGQQLVIRAIRTSHP